MGLEVGLGANLLGFSLEGMPSKCSLERLTVHNLWWGGDSPVLAAGSESGVCRPVGVPPLEAMLYRSPISALLFCHHTDAAALSKCWRLKRIRVREFWPLVSLAKVRNTP